MVVFLTYRSNDMYWNEFMSNDTWYGANDTSRSGVLNVRHITWTAYERATYHEINTHKRASGQERRKRDRSSRHVCQRVCEFRDLSVLGMSQQCIVK